MEERNECGNEITFIVPGHCVPAVRTTQRQQFVCKNYAKYQAYKSYFGTLAATEKNKIGGFYCPPKSAIILETKIFRYRKNRVDVDNLLKSIMDSLTGILWDDDSQVFSATAKKFWVRSEEEEHVKVWIKHMSYTEYENIIETGVN